MQVSYLCLPPHLVRSSKHSPSNKPRYQRFWAVPWVCWFLEGFVDRLLNIFYANDEAVYQEKMETHL